MNQIYNELEQEKPKMISRKFFLSALSMICVLLLLPNNNSLRAELYDQGGHSERFSGGGDKVPPSCQLDLPVSASEPFYIRWNCDDNDSSPDDIRTELWMLRHGETTPELHANFLGFPAAAYIDKNVLKVEDFHSGLPSHFRLLARDRAGNATISPFRSVLPKTLGLSSCTVDVTTVPTISTGTSTGIPAMAVFLETTSITSQQLSSNQARIATTSAQNTTICEINILCQNDSNLAFTSSFTVSSGNSVSGTIRLSPGNIAADLTGFSQTPLTTTSPALLFTNLELSGTTRVDGQDAEVTLSCRQ
jgi:hypothetical protein